MRSRVCHSGVQLTSCRLYDSAEIGSGPVSPSIRIFVTVQRLAYCPGSLAIATAAPKKRSRMLNEIARALLAEVVARVSAIFIHDLRKQPPDHPHPKRIKSLF